MTSTVTLERPTSTAQDAIGNDGLTASQRAKLAKKYLREAARPLDDSELRTTVRWLAKRASR